jgi:hypothetical protein
MTDKKPLLTLEQLAGDRDNIVYGGKKFEIKSAGEFKLAPLARLSLRLAAFQEALAGGDYLVLQAAFQSMDSLIVEICPGIVSDKAVYSRLINLDKIEIIQTFLTAQAQAANDENEESRNENEEPPEPTDWGSLLPRLQKFYGGSPLDWLELPMMWLKCFAEMLQPLKAETMLELGQGVFTGSWPTSKEHQDALRSAMESLNQMTGGGITGGEGMSMEEAEERYMSIGIPVTHYELEDVSFLENLFSKN